MIALVIAAVMVLGMATSAMADDPADGVTTNNYTLTINNTVENHVYTAYQIFKGSKADTSQVAYTELASGATYDADTTYYYKNGEDYDVDTTINSAETFGAAKSAHQLYTRTGSSSLGQVSWGDDITDEGKVALYAAYNITDKDGNAFTTSSTDLNDAAKVQALVDAIANPTDTATSESDKAVKFSEVFFTTETDGDVTPITTPAARLKTPAAGQVKTADSTGSVEYTGLPSGYYLINDTYEAQAGEVNGIDYSIARIAVQVVGNTTINNKADKVTSKKKIKTSSELLNEKANELGIGRVVEYEVTEVVPNYTQYNYYYFDVRDHMAEGLTFNPDSVKVTVGGTEITKLVAPATSTTGKGYYLYSDPTADADVLSANNNNPASTFVLAFENIMKFNVGDPIVITYTANVNSSAVTGIDPNTNEVKVDYSNDPKTSEKHDIDQNHPGVPAYDDNTPTGTTPKSVTNTYTTKVTIHKVDEDGNPLENVEFVLTGKAKDTVLKTDTVYELDNDGTYYMLKDGTYTDRAPQTAPTLRETQENSGWVKIEGTDDYDGDDIRVIGTDKYRPFVNGEDNGKTRYVIVEPNEAAYASTTLRYSPVTKTTLATDTATEEYSVAMTGKTDASGNLVFSQLGAGEYTLAETVVLPGYNDISDITFTITCGLPAANTVTAGTETCSWNIGSGTHDTANSGIKLYKKDGTEITSPTSTTTDGAYFGFTIENNKGTELPSTGGIGTTIFYAMGGILLLGAAILLVSKRRAY